MYQHQKGKVRRVFVGRLHLSSMVEISGVDADRIIRSHWTVENQLHWSLDVTFKEDASRISDGNAAQNLRAMRRIAISLLKQDPEKN